ncbi:helix-turn-helix transcriptional regulator [Microbacterium sp. B2969]|uniref:Helix-turn-helix transcriptional regulator n=1 Tax=Microbacterium alkaliflavum TaxID=3248839 RepID=A0ABW7Q645_9MICO
MGLFERELEAEALRAELGSLSDAGRVVTVTGDAGSGKTALLAAVLGGDDAVAAPAAGIRVLRGLCDPLGTPRPLGPVRDILQLLGIRDVDGAELERTFLERVSGQPTVLVIEDAQWIDAASSEILRFLIRRIDRLPVLLVLSYRDGGIGFGHALLPLLGEVSRTEHSRRLALQPLSRGAVREILGDAGPDPVRVHDLTGGNPFFVTEIARHPDEELPATVRDAVLASTFGLTDGELDVLQLIAAAPDALDDRLLPLLRIDVPTLRRLEATGLLVRTRRGIGFRHELARRAIVDGTPTGLDRVLHERLLDALAAIGSADQAVLTHHAVAAGDAARILRHARLAAGEATRTGSHSEAVAFLGLALAHLPGDTAERAQLLERLSTEQYMVSRLAEARGSARAALAIRERLGDADGIAAAHDRRAIIEYYSARRRAAEEQADLAAQAGGGAAASASAQATRAYLAYRRQDLTTAREIAARARELAEATTEEETDAARRRLAITEAAAQLVEGRTASRALLLLQASAAIQVSLDEIGTTAYSNLSALDIEHRRLAEAEAVLAEAIPLTIEREIPICYQWQTGMRARLHFLRGRWTASGEDAARVLDDHGAPLASIWPHVVSALLRLRQGAEPAAIDEHLAQAWDHARELDESPLLLAVLAAYAERAWHTGEWHPVLDHAATEVARADAFPGNAWAIGDLLVWLARIGRPMAATQVAEPQRLELDGRHQEAVDAWLALGTPFDAALAGLGDPAPDAALRALARLEQLGVDGTTARARELLSGRGIPLPARPRRTTASNPSGLTNRQLDVARLVAQGLTNGELAERLYISPKTADHHVSAVLGKLGVSSRREIVRSAVSLGLV